jgi:hypothetical protein
LATTKSRRSIGWRWSLGREKTEIPSDDANEKPCFLRARQQNARKKGSRRERETKGGELQTPLGTLRTYLPTYLPTYHTVLANLFDRYTRNLSPDQNLRNL